MNTRSSLVRRIAVLTLTLMPVTGSAFSLGAPICEVNTLPLIEMSSTLASPPPAGWVLETRPYYQPGQVQTLRVRNTQDPLRQARGILIWAKLGPFTGAGSFAPGPLYQYIPAPAVCGEWALSHNSSTPKSQSELVFPWTAPEAGTPILRAFIIEECGLGTGACRSFQALTPLKALYEAIHVDGLEDPVL